MLNLHMHYAGLTQIYTLNYFYNLCMQQEFIIVYPTSLYTLDTNLLPSS